jgi:hypothetical protein
MNITQIENNIYRVEKNDDVAPFFGLDTVNKFNSYREQVPFYYKGYIILLSKDGQGNWYLNSISKKQVGFGGSPCGAIEQAIKRAVMEIDIREEKRTSLNNQYKERINKAFSKEILPILIDVINNMEVK